MQSKKRIKPSLPLNYEDDCYKIASLLDYISVVDNNHDRVSALITKFGSVTDLFSSSIEVLISEGLNKKEALLIKLVHSITKSYYASIIGDTPNRYEPALLKKYCLTHYSNLEKESLAVLIYNKRGEFVKESMLSVGSSRNVEVCLRTLLTELLRYEAYGAILIHNHPGGSSEPSRTDLSVTASTRILLKEVDIELIDHFIVGQNLVYSIEHKKHL